MFIQEHTYFYALWMCVRDPGYGYRAMYSFLNALYNS